MTIIEFVQDLNDKLDFSSVDIPQVLKDCDFDLTQTYLEVTGQGTNDTSCLLKKTYNDKMLDPRKYGLGMISLKKELQEASTSTITFVKQGHTDKSSKRPDFTLDTSAICDFRGKLTLTFNREDMADSVSNMNISIELQKVIDDNGITVFNIPIPPDNLSQNEEVWTCNINNPKFLIVLPQGVYRFIYYISFDSSYNGTYDTKFTLGKPTTYTYPQNTIDLTI